MLVAAVERKDVVVAIIATAAGFAGFALVFLGVVFSDSFKPDLSREDVSPLAAPLVGLGLEIGRWLTGVAVVAVFILGVIAANLGVIWLVVGHGQILYVTMLVVFFLDSVALIAVGLFVANWALSD